MRIKLTRDVKLVDGNTLPAGTEFDTLPDSKPCALIDGTPRRCEIAYNDEGCILFFPEFEIVQE